MEVLTLRLEDIHVARHLQPRGGDVCPDGVRDYAAAIRGGAKLPRMVAYRVTDRKFPGPALVAGFHRHPAYKAAGVEAVEVEVHTGTYAEAWLAGYRSNLANGLRYTTAQKRAATEQALLLFRDDSIKALADRIGVSRDLVARIREELVRLKKLEPVETVKTRDGKRQPSTHKRSSDVESTSDDRKSDATVTEPAVGAPPPASLFTDPGDAGMDADGETTGDSGVASDDIPDRGDVDQLRVMAFECEQDGADEDAAEWEEQATVLADAIDRGDTEAAKTIRDKGVIPEQYLAQQSQESPPSEATEDEPAADDGRTDEPSSPPPPDLGSFGGRPVLPERPKKPKPGDVWPAACADTRNTKFFPRVVVTPSGSEAVIDAYGQPVPAGTGDYFNDPAIPDLYARAMRAAAELEAAYRELSRLKGKVRKSYPWTDYSAATDAIEAARKAAAAMAEEIGESLPYAVCPKCHGHPRQCKECSFCGYWPVSVCNERADQLPKLHRPAAV